MKGPAIIILLFILFVSSLALLVATYNLTGAVVIEPDSRLEVHFCFAENCSRLVAESIKPDAVCALYDLSEQVVINALQTNNIPLVIDNANLDKNTLQIEGVRVDHDRGLMHNKFCVMGSEFTIGSYNPTKNHNYDNLLLITSPALAQNYREEWEELWAGTFGKGNPVQNPLVQIGDILVENYFCPDDACEEHVDQTLRAANSTIDVMAFSLTNNVIGKTIINLHKQGIKIRTVSDKSQLGEFSEDFIFNRSGIPIKFHDGRGKRNLLHHKVFIIDNAIVITGSANPTFGGYHKNDENILILHSPKLAQQYKQEFESIWALS